MKILLGLLLTTSIIYAQRSLVLDGATLIDGTFKAPVANSVIIIQGTKIIAVGTHGDVTIPTDAEIIDVSGKYIIPGLIDCHIRCESPRDLVQLLAWGVTSANCVFESTDQALEMEKRTAGDTMHSPQIYATAPVFTVAGGWWYGQAYPVDSTINRIPNTPDEAREQIRKVKAKGIKRIKLIYDDMSWCRDSLPRLVQMRLDVMAALVNGAQQESLLCEIHAPQALDAEDVIGAAIRHEYLALVHGIIDKHIEGTEVTSGMKEIPLGAKIAGHHIFYISTFCLFEFLADTKGFMEHALADERFRAALPDESIKQYINEEYFQRYATRYPNMSFVKSHLGTLRDNVKNLVGFTERIVLGTDMWALPGIGAHLEMEYMVEAGVDPFHVLVSATNGAANFLGKGKKKARAGGFDLGEIGTIDSSKQADLLILDANPLEDIRNTRSVHTIIKHGKIFDHKQLIEESKR